MLLLFTLICSSTALDNAHIHYLNYAVLSTIPKTPDQLSALNQIYLQDTKYQTDFWNAPIAIGKRVTLGVPKPKAEEIIELLKPTDSDFIAKDLNLKALIDEEKRLNPPQFFKGNKSSLFAIDKYHRYTEIEEYLKQIELEYPDLVKRSVIGQTVENREIIAMKIMSETESIDEKPIILIDAGIHAREWLAPSTALYIIDTLITNYDSDSEVKYLIDSYDWYIIPVMNPDGYDYTWKVDRMWRKNRRPSTLKVFSTLCSGVDPNRNFGLGFGGESTSNFSCSDIYCGEAPFSERESQALKSITEENAHRIQIAISLHAYGQMWMNPWGYKAEKPADYDIMVSAAKKAVDALKEVNGLEFQVGTSYEVIYPLGGASIDWQYSVIKSPYTYTVELRPTHDDPNFNGFVMPNTYIMPTAEETWAGVKMLAYELF